MGGPWKTGPRVLDVEKVRQIRALHREGKGTTAIAEAVGCSRGAVLGVIKRRTWTHIDG